MRESEGEREDERDERDEREDERESEGDEESNLWYNQNWRSFVLLEMGR